MRVLSSIFVLLLFAGCQKTDFIIPSIQRVESSDFNCLSTIAGVWQNYENSKFTGESSTLYPVTNTNEILTLDSKSGLEVIRLCKTKRKSLYLCTVNSAIIGNGLIYTNSTDHIGDVGVFLLEINNSRLLSLYLLHEAQHNAIVRQIKLGESFLINAILTEDLFNNKDVFNRLRRPRHHKP